MSFDYKRHQQAEQELQEALHLIKLHIGPEEIPMNHDLHNAVQLLVTAARRYGHLVR